MNHRKDEKPLAKVREAHFCRCEQSSLNRVTKALKVSPDAAEARRQVRADVFEEQEPGPGLDDDAAERRPQPPGICDPEALAGAGFALARVAANEAIHEATPRAAVEGSGIRPHRSRIQESRLHKCHQPRDGRGLPLHQADASSAGNCQLDAEIKPSASGAEGEDIEGGM